LGTFDFSWEGFRSGSYADDNHNNVVVFVRRDPERGNELIAAVNFFARRARGLTASASRRKRRTARCLPTDLPAYGGTGDWRNEGELLTESIPSHGKPCSLCVTIPPLGAVFFAGEGEWQEEVKTNERPRCDRTATKQGGENKREERMYRHAACRRPGQPSLRTHGEYGEARRAVWRQVPHH